MASTEEQPAEVTTRRPVRKRTVRADGEQSAPASAPRKRTVRKRAQPQRPEADQPAETALDLAVTEALGLTAGERGLEFEPGETPSQPADQGSQAGSDEPGADERGSHELSGQGGSEPSDVHGDDASADVGDAGAVEDGVDVEDSDEENADDEDADDEDDVSEDTHDDEDDDLGGMDRQIPNMGLLFQAPRPIVQRSRRAARPERYDPQTGPQAQQAAPADALEAASGGEVEPAESASDTPSSTGRRRRRRGGKGRRSRVTDPASEADGTAAEGSGSDAQPGSATDTEPDDAADDGTSPRRRTRRRRRSGSGVEGEDSPGVVTKVREPRRERDEVVGVKGSTRLEAKKQRRREGREAGRRRTIITEAEFLARRESVERVMLVRRVGDRTQIAVLEDKVLVEHYVSRDTNVSMAGNIYLGKVQNVLPSMEAAFVDIGKGRNAVLYAGEVNWDAAGLESGRPKRIENALESGQPVLVQVTKDPMGHKGARLTSQISLPGRYLVYVPDSGMTGISRKLPDTERTRLKRILREIVPESAGVIVRTAAEGASEADLRADVERLAATWEQIRGQAASAGTARKGKGGPPVLLHGEADLTVRVIRDIFNEDFAQLVVSGEDVWGEVSGYVNTVAPDLAERVSRWTSEDDLFRQHRVDEQIAKAMDRKVWLPSGGSLVIDRTEAMTVIDVNTGKFVGSGGNLEETVTRNNIEAAEEIVRQLRLRDIGGIIVIDFIDMVLESNRDLVVRRLLECLGRDRTKHQVAEVTSLGLVQMTRKRVGSGLIEVFSETCEHCNGRGYLIHSEPVDRPEEPASGPSQNRGPGRRGRHSEPPAPPAPPPGGPTPAQIAAAAHAAAIKSAHPASAVAPDAGIEPLEGSAEPLGGSTEPVGAATEPRDGIDAPQLDLVAATDAPPADLVAATDAPPSPDAEAPHPETSLPPEVPAREPGDLQDGNGAQPGDEPGNQPAPWHDGADEPPGGGDLNGNGDAPAPPRRRRHGRVVAPAGPPVTHDDPG